MKPDDTARFTPDGCEVGVAQPIPKRIETDAEDYYRSWPTHLIGIAYGCKSQLDYEVADGPTFFDFDPKSFSTYERRLPTRYFRVYREKTK